MSLAAAMLADAGAIFAFLGAVVFGLAYVAAAGVIALVLACGWRVFVPRND